MNLQRKIKYNSKRALSGHWGNAIVILFLFACLELLFSTISTLSGYIMGINGVFDVFNTPEIFIDNIPDLTLLALGFNTFMAMCYSMLRDPLKIGQYFWYYNIAGANHQEVLSIFTCFSSYKTFFRAIWININIRIRKFFWGIILYTLPIISIYAGIFTINSYKETSDFYVVLGAVLVFCGITLWGLFSIIGYIIFQKYFLAPYYMINDSLSVRESISRSIKASKGEKTKIALFRLSFLGWYFLNILIIPLIYSQPYIETSKAMYAKYLIDLYELKSSSGETESSSDNGATISFETPQPFDSENHNTDSLE